MSFISFSSPARLIVTSAFMMGLLQAAPASPEGPAPVFSENDRQVVISGSSYSAAFSKKDGSFQISSGAKAAPFTRSRLLWKIERREQADSLDSSEFLDQGGSFRSVVDKKTNTLLLEYASPDLAVTIRVAPGADSFDFIGEIVRTSKEITCFLLPADLNFAAKDVRLVVFPQSGLRSYGIGFTEKFFGKHAAEDVALQPVMTGGSPYAFLFGQSPKVLSNMMEPVRLQVTEEGREWFTSGQIEAISRYDMRINRASKLGQFPAQYERRAQCHSAADGGKSGNDGILEAIRADGWGWLWRLTGVDTSREVSRTSVLGVLEYLASHPWPQPQPLFYPQIWDVEIPSSLAKAAPQP
ncbi:MAG: hypothetical protein J0I10_23155 [Verrucomicrobia bacterium]|nr:hypothetical protein [Verrucomicrobiota bacterium]